MSTDTEIAALGHTLAVARAAYSKDLLDSQQDIGDTVVDGVVTETAAAKEMRYAAKLATDATNISDALEALQEAEDLTSFNNEQRADFVAAQNSASIYSVTRVDPWLISCERWFEQGMYICLPLNAEQLDFNVPLRVAHDDGCNCKFIYIWRRRNTNSMNGQISINFSLSSANVIPAFDISDKSKLDLASKYTGSVPPSEDMVADSRKGILEYTQAGVAGLYDKAIPIGVSNLYALLALADEYRVRRASNALDSEGRHTSGQTANRIVMCISTMIFPRLLLYGWFSPDGISFSMNADNPAEFTVTFTLLITSTFPSLGNNNWAELIRSYKSNMFEQPRTVDWASARFGSKTRLSNTKDDPNS
jgi:hypothetical protein